MLGILFYVLTPHVLSDGNVEWCSLISMCSCSGSGCVLTPHVLSEWMVEVCRFDKCGVLFVLVCSFRAGV